MYLKIQNSLALFWPFPLVSLFTFKQKKWLVRLNSKIKARKGLNQKILTWWCFMKNSLFDSLFLVNLVFSLRIFYVSWKDTVYGLLKFENEGLEQLPDDVGFVPKPSFNAENLPFIISRTLTYVRMPVYAYTCMEHAYAELEAWYKIKKKQD